MNTQFNFSGEELADSKQDVRVVMKIIIIALRKISKEIERIANLIEEAQRLFHECFLKIAMPSRVAVFRS